MKMNRYDILLGKKQSIEQEIKEETCSLQTPKVINIEYDCRFFWPQRFIGDIKEAQAILIHRSGFFVSYQLEISVDILDILFDFKDIVLGIPGHVSTETVDDKLHALTTLVNYGINTTCKRVEKFEYCSLNAHTNYSVKFVNMFHGFK